VQMKPVITFVLGALLATAIALFVVKQEPAPAPVVESPVAATTPAPVDPQPINSEPVEPEPAPIAAAPPRSTTSRIAPARRETRASTPPPRKEPRRESPTFSSTSTSQSPVASAPANNTPSTQTAQQQSNTTSTTVGSQGGPPQTTLHMPPPPSAISERPAAPVRVPKTVTIPAGTLLSVRVDERLSSETVQMGDSFRASLDQPLVVDGAVIAERGARVEGRIANADRGGRVRGTASMGLELVRLNTADGQRVRLQTEGFTKQAERSTKKDAAKVGIGAGLGAAIGAIAGGGKGAAIGAGIGGAAGAGGVMATRGEAVEIPSETRLTFRLQEAITLTEKLK
jgi:hypothetical protein